MKRIATIVAAIAALGIAVFVFSGRSGGRAAAAGKDASLASDRLSSKTERIDNDHAPERFDSLDAGMKELALELEKAAIKWDRNRPELESAHRLDNDWRKYSIDRISALSTAQIRQLSEWMDSNSVFNSELHNYRQALILIWSSREPDVVRARLMEAAESAGYFEMNEVKSWHNARLEELADDFLHARVGHATKDPKAAWEAFLKDDADPRMKYLGNGRITISEIFREYSARLPEDAWSLALAAQDDDYCSRMVEGFADGAPAGQNWEERGRELAESLTNRGAEALRWPFQSIGERWIMEDPVAALDWYARSAPSDALEWANDRLNSSTSGNSGTSDDPFADPFADDPFKKAPPSDPSEAANLLKVDLLVEMYGSYKDRTREVIAALDHLATHGEEPLAAATVGKLVGTNLDPMDTPLLEVIARIPSQEDRNALFLQAIHAIPVRNNSPFAMSFNTLEGPNASLTAVRNLTARLDLPEEIRTEAEAAFRKVEDEELKALEDAEWRRRNDGAPFSSR